MMSRSFGEKRSSGTMPVVRSSNSVWKKPSNPISSPQLIDKWQYQHLSSDPAEKTRYSVADREPVSDTLPCFYEKVQSLVQSMLHSENGIPIRSHRNKLLSAVPSVFTGSDMINWLIRRLQCSKPEAIHVALLIYKHGYFYSVDKDELQIKEDNTLFRFQTPHLWSSQNFDDSDYTYSIFLLKQIKRSKNSKGIALTDYQLSDLRKLQSEYSVQWDEINSKANDEVRVIKEQRKIARQLITCQEKAFWRLRRPPPGETKISDCVLTKFGIERKRNDKKQTIVETEKSLIKEIELLKRMINSPSQNFITSLENVTQNCKKYVEFDPILKTPAHGNPWTTNDDNLWALERSLVEYPSERKLKNWTCSLNDMLRDVTGRYNFEAFCKKQYCSENIRFWQAIQDLQMLPLIAVPGAVALIYDEFIDSTAQDMVNLSAQAVTEAEQDLLNPSRYSFALAQEEIYKLMETDIYPRYLSTDHDRLLKSASNTNSVGKNFLKKFITRSTSNRSDTFSPVEIVSPCHPLRYTKRELSIGKKPHASNSFDNLFLATNNSSSNEASDMIGNLVSPFANNEMMLSPPTAVRRVSAPVIKYKPTRPLSPTASNLTNSIITPSPRSPTYSDNSSYGLSPLGEEECQNGIQIPERKMEDEGILLRRNERTDRRLSDERAVMRQSVMISRSMEDLSNLADEEDGMIMAMQQDTFQMGLMSLRTPVDNFLFDEPKLDRFDNMYDLYQDPESGLSPTVMTSLKKFNSGVRPSVASLGLHMLSIPAPRHHSSNDSIHSAISVG